MPNLTSNDYDTLTPTEQLCLEVLIARHRLGDDLWTFSSRNASALQSLEDKGWVVTVHPIVEKSLRARLTPEAVPALVEPKFTPRVLQQYEDLLGSIWLYIKWRYVTKQLTTVQKEMFADAVDAASRRLNEDDEEWTPVAERWWRE